MAIENEKLRQQYCAQHVCMGAARMEDKHTEEEQKQKKVIIERSMYSGHEITTT